MKRFLRRLELALALAVILTALVPVTAQAEGYNPWVDIAEVCTVNDSGTNYFAFNNSTTVTLDPGFTTIVGRIDMIWFCGYHAPETVYIWRNELESSRRALTIEQINGSYYRIYGSIGNYTLSEYKFDIDCGPVGYCSYEIKSCRIIEANALSDIEWSYDFDDGRTNLADRYSQNVVLNPSVSLSNGMLRSYTWDILPENWITYDYLDLYVVTQYASIDSIAITQGKQAIPFTVSHLLYDAPTMVDGSLYDSPMQPSVTVMIHIDLTSASRSIGNDPHIVITGRWNDGHGGGLQINSFCGYIDATERTGPAYWFERATAFLKDLFGGDSAEADDFKDDMQQQGQQVEDAADQIDTVTRPNLDDVDVDISQFIDAEGTQQAADLFGQLFSNNLVLTMVMISLMVALAAFIIFGKR